MLQGCAPLPLINGETLYVMVTTQWRMDWLKRSKTHDRLWNPLLKEYQRLHPNVRVSIYTVREEDISAQLRQRSARGLGPDLILTRAAMANTLLREGLIAPVPKTPGMQRSIAQIWPDALGRVRNGTELAAVPVSDVVTLACRDRSSLPNPPRTTDELMAAAVSGHIIGLSMDAFGIWWTAGTQGAADELIPILLGEVVHSPGSDARAQKTIAGWLAWLRQLAVLSRVDLASGPEELSQGLRTGRLDWIPCYSLTLGTLREAMGDRLGVSALPTGSFQFPGCVGLRPGFQCSPATTGGRSGEAERGSLPAEAHRARKPGGLVCESAGAHPRGQFRCAGGPGRGRETV